LENSSSILCIVRQFRLVLMKAGTPQTAQVRLNADGTRSAEMPATGVIGRLSRCGYELIYLNRALAILRA
jgi:hypothetical protein